MEPNNCHTLVILAYEYTRVFGLYVWSWVSAIMLLRKTLICLVCYLLDSGPRLNIKTVLSTYGDFHVKDKTAVRTSYL